MADDGGSLRFPVAHEFSPGQVDLRRVLQLILENEGDRDAIVEAIRREYYADAAKKRADPDERLAQQNERSSNVLRGMGPNGYQLFDLTTNRLTEFAHALLGLSDEDELYGSLARHILRNCHGMTLLDAVRALQDRHVRVTKGSLATELRSLGYERLPTATTHHTTMLNWLAKAGVIDSRRVIDEQVVSDILGFDTSLIAEWRSLTREQQAFLRTLRASAEVTSEPVSTSEILTKAIIEHGPIFREDQLRSRVTQPLAGFGWLELEVKKGGRGAKSGQVRATAKLLEIDIDLLGVDRAWGIPADLRERLNTPLEAIQRDLATDDTYVKGIALELLAVRLAHDLGLIPRAFRLRGSATGGAEVDLVAEGAHLHFSRWLFQCKNVDKPVGLSELAKEVGMAVMLRAHVIVMVTTSTFSETVRVYAKELMDSNYLQVVLVDGEVIKTYVDHGPPALRDHFHQEAGRVMSLKRTQLSRADSDA